MEQEISRNGKNLIVRLSIPLKRGNDGMDNIVGTIAGDEIGFAYLLDRSYKGKEDDISSPFYFYQGEEENFRELCKKMGIKVVEYPICAYCSTPIFSAFTFSKKGISCFECEKESKVVV